MTAGKGGGGGGVCRGAPGGGAAREAGHGEVGGGAGGRPDHAGRAGGGQENEALEDEPPAGRPGDNALGCGDRPLPRGWRGHQACTSRPGSGTSLEHDRALTRARMRRSKLMPVGTLIVSPSWGGGEVCR